MNPLIQKLTELQALDLRVAELRQQIRSYPEQLARIDEGVNAARGAVEKAKQRVADLRKDRKKLELDVEDWRGKIKKYKEQLYQVKTNEAYKALQAEIANAEAEMGRAEDRLLEEMVGSEDADREVKQAEAALGEAEKEAGREKEQVLGEKSRVEAEFAEVEAASKQRLGELPEELVEHYARIARKHNGVALAEARDEACSMCSVRIRPHVMQQLRQAENEEIIHCETCTRILYYVEKKTPPAEGAQASLAEAGNP
jgi:predicted  nucleic acid-binding Zn-ribbon protein